MATCKLERKHYKYVIIGCLVTIVVILISVFLSGSKENLGDDAEKSKQVGNETNHSPTTNLSTESINESPNKGGSESTGKNSEEQTQGKPSNSGGSESTGKNSEEQTQGKPSNSGGSESTGKNSEEQTQGKPSNSGGSESTGKNSEEQTQGKPSNSDGSKSTGSHSDQQTQKHIRILNDSCTSSGEFERSGLLNYVLIEQADECRNLDANFYIDNKGNVHNGTGWDKTHGGGKYLSLVIIGSSSGTTPGNERDVKGLLEYGVANNIIASGYEIVFPVGLDKNLEKLVEELSRYRKIHNGVHPTAFARRPGKFPVVFAKEWSQEKVESMSQAEPQINEVEVKDGGTRCFDIESCIESARKIQGKLVSNFYVAEDGFAYESSGWKSESGKMVVQFLGLYKDRNPSPAAFLAFRRLLKLGVWLGAVSHDYKLTDSSSGKKLVKELNYMYIS